MSGQYSNAPHYVPGARPPGAGQSPPSPPQYAPHYPEQAFIMNTGPRETSINKLTMPIVMFFGAIITVGVAAAFAATQLTTLGHKIDTVQSTLGLQIERLGNSLERRVSKNETGVGAIRAGAWARKDHEFWCARTEQVNTALGWRCAENPGDPRRVKSSHENPRTVNAAPLGEWKMSK